MSPPRKAAAPARQMCAVTIGFQTLVLPASKGMALVDLLQHAVLVEREFMKLADVYEVQDQPRVELALIKPEQLRFPAGTETPQTQQAALRLK